MKHSPEVVELIYALNEYTGALGRAVKHLGTPEAKNYLYPVSVGMERLNAALLPYIDIPPEGKT